MNEVVNDMSMDNVTPEQAKKLLDQNEIMREIADLDIKGKPDSTMDGVEDGTLRIVSPVPGKVKG